MGENGPDMVCQPTSSVSPLRVTTAHCPYTTCENTSYTTFLHTKTVSNICPSETVLNLLLMYY